MPFVPPLSMEDAPQEAKPTLEKIREKFGKTMNLFHTLAYQPKLLEGVTSINNGIQAELPAKLRELAYYYSSRLNNCGYCSHYHQQAAEKAGVSQEQFAALDDFANSAAFNEQEKSVLLYADQLTKQASVESETITRLKAFLKDEQLVVLAATVALANFTNRFNHGLDIELP